MSRFVWKCLSLLWTTLLAVQAADTSEDQLILPEMEPIPAPVVSSASLTSGHCECQIFIQSWKTSHMIRLPIGMEPIQLNNATVDGDLCLIACQEKLPPQSEANDEWWTRLYRRACRTLRINDNQVQESQDARIKNKNKQKLAKSINSSGPVRGCLQAYSRYSNTHIWVPMGPEYRKVISCADTQRNRRSLKTKGSGLNSIDAQSVVVSQQINVAGSNKFPSDSFEEGANPKRPLVINMTPIRTVLKQLGILSSMPYLENVIGMVDRKNIRDMLDRIRLGSYVDRYQKLYNEYTDEMDVGHCYLEYLAYTLFNHRFSLKNTISSSFGTSRGFEQDSLGMIVHGISEFLQRENSSQVLTALFKMIPSPRRPALDEEGSPAMAPPVPDVQALATNIARFYLRNYFSTLPGSTVRVDDRDPSNNPESLADMVEQVSRPIFLSVFGVVPGVPASGRLDHLLLVASKEKARPVTPPSSNFLGFGNTESRNKLTPLDHPPPPPPPRWTSSNGIQRNPYEKQQPHHRPQKTGNAFFDLGNAFFGTIQRANDATHGLYCVKQYAVNRMWDGFRGSMRRMMRAIPSAG